ncbi:MAG TPA: HlyD family efflux transporter periplasmic adaptor subunit [Hyphomonadaceae bacterium]|nr:HlyD family efflux transporter periplasmic adaptor subunit [Hyphomonadaceae bacterium]
MKPQQILIAVLVVSAAALAGFLVFGRVDKEAATLSGYVEGEPLYPASPVAGRLVQINVQRGDQVKAGQTLFQVDPTQSEAALSQAQAETSAAAALAADAKRGQRPAELGVIEAQLGSAQAVLNEANANLNRVRPLEAAGAASREQLDSAIAAQKTAEANVRAIEKQLQVAKLGQREDQARAAQDRVRQAEAAQAAAAARLTDIAPPAPAAGRIEDVYFQLGEWVPANQPVLAMIPQGRTRLRFFVPETEVAAYQIGSEVGFACDGCAKDLKAKISYVSPRPEFTPPVIYSRESRDRLVFLVEAMPASEAGLTPGQPVDVQPLKATK